MTTPNVRVSVIMPCYNEEFFLADTVSSLVDEFFHSCCELLIVDGMSTDKTVEKALELRERGMPIRILSNPQKTQAEGLNIGILEARGNIIVRADGHSIYPQGYIRTCVDLLEKTGAANVGGIMRPQGKTPLQRAIAEAMQHPLGVGDAKFHLGNYSGYVDTVYLGTFRKDLFDELGLFDPSCTPNEDAEFNLRILKSGKKIFLDSQLVVLYIPRGDFQRLARQYFRYGQGRFQTTKKHRRVTSLRQVAPPFLILGLGSSLLLGWKYPVLFLIPLAYVIGVFLTTLLSRFHDITGFKQKLLVGSIFLLMHISWGLGFLSGLFQKTGKKGES